MPNGLLYGTASAGGAHDGGTVFAISPDGVSFSVLHAFLRDGGEGPETRLTPGTDGGLLGVTHGSIFRITTEGVFSSVHSFDASAQDSHAGLVRR